MTTSCIPAKEVRVEQEEGRVSLIIEKRDGSIVALDVLPGSAPASAFLTLVYGAN